MQMHQISSKLIVIDDFPSIFLVFYYFSRLFVKKIIILGSTRQVILSTWEVKKHQLRRKKIWTKEFMFARLNIMLINQAHIIYGSVGGRELDRMSIVDFNIICNFFYSLHFTSCRYDENPPVLSFFFFPSSYLLYFKTCSFILFYKP